MTTIKVQFSDACTDVLVWLSELDEHQWRYVEQIADAVAPADVERPRLATSNALHTLRECGLVTFQKIDADVTWQITAEGRAIVAEAVADDTCSTAQQRTTPTTPEQP